MNNGNLREAIDAMVSEKGITQEMVLDTIKDFVKAAYKRKFGTDENVDIQFSEDLNTMNVCAIRQVVDEDNYYNEVTEIPLDEAQELAENVAIGDSLMIPLDINSFDRGAVQSAKQKAQQSFKEIQNNSTYKEFKEKEGEIIQCYVRSKTMNGDLILNVGNDNEGVLPYRNQSPRETYNIKDSVRCYVERVENNDAQQKFPDDDKRARKQHRGVRIILSRTSPDMIRKLLEIQVPEIANHQVEVVKIARQAGSHTKIAVRSASDDIDPIGATVGLKGNRIQSIMAEIEGEKIDVIRWDENPLQLIANALTPATVQKILPIDLNKHSAIAIVDENQLGLAIGVGGVNVKLAKQLCDWMIEVKTQAQYEEMEISQETREKAEELFSNPHTEEHVEEPEAEETPLTADQLGVNEDETLLSDINIPENLVQKLNYHDIYTVEEYLELSDDEKHDMEITEEEENAIASCIDVEEEQEEQFECPNCGSILPAGTTKCPKCGVEFEFEFE